MENQTAQPFNIPPNTPPPAPQGAKKGGIKALLPKFIILAVVVAVAIGGFSLYRNLSQKRNASEAVSQIQPLSGAEIVLISDKKEYQVGEIVPVTVKLFTGGYTTIGSDLILKYNPATLEIQNAGDILVGDAYSEFPLKTFDTQAGVIAVSGISALNKDGFNGIGTFATVNFRAKQAGVAKVTVDFTPKATVDSNVIKAGSGVEASEDILAKVTNIDITIK